MAWKISFDPAVKRDLARLDKSIQRRINRYLLDRVAQAPDPELLGKPLIGKLSGFRRYRVADYRIVCRVQQTEIVVLVLAVGHRKDIYDRLT